MKHPNEPQSEDCWLTFTELSKALDISDKAVREIKRYVPAKWLKAGKPMKLYGRGAILLWASRQGGVDADDSAVMSPALERKRELECERLRIELDKQVGDLVPRSQMRGLLMGMAAVLRRTGELLVRKFGNDAGEVLQEGIDDMDRLAQAEGFGDDG